MGVWRLAGYPGSSVCPHTHAHMNGTNYISGLYLKEQNGDKERTKKVREGGEEKGRKEGVSIAHEVGKQVCWRDFKGVGVEKHR